jgi:hypothetical protein
MLRLKSLNITFSNIRKMVQDGTRPRMDFVSIMTSADASIGNIWQK